MNLTKTMYRLQTALCNRGIYIKINQFQNYSEKIGKMVTKFVVQEKRTMYNGEEKYVTVLETYQKPEIVEFLAKMLGGG